MASQGEAQTIGEVAMASQGEACRQCATAGALKVRSAELEAALRAIFDAADQARDEQDWSDRVSDAMTDDRRALITT